LRDRLTLLAGACSALRAVEIDVFAVIQKKRCDANAAPLLALFNRTGEDLKCLLSEMKRTNVVDARLAESDP
jgi:hypothetical protein